MKKIGQILDEISTATKTAFVPAPSQGGQASQPQGGQDQAMSQLLSQLPPEIAQQISGLPPDQQMQALQQLMQGQQGGQEGQEGDKPQAGGQGEQIQSSGPPTDLENSTITLRVRDLLDLVSGGNATKATLKVQEHMQKGQMRQQQMQEKAEADKQRKAQQDAQKQQAEAMAGSGPNMMGGGIY